MLPRKDSSTDVASSKSRVTVVSSTPASSATSSATALFNTAVPSPATTLPPTAAASATPSPSPTSSGQSSSSTSAKVIGGVVAAFVGILIIFAVTTFYLRRRWVANERIDTRRAVHEAGRQRDEEEGGGEDTAFMRDNKRHSMAESVASTRSKASTDDYLKSGRKRSSLGTYHLPGIAPEEAYMIFGGSTASLDEEEKPLTYHQRHLSESASSNRYSISGPPDASNPRSRRISLLDDDSRYPAANASTDSLGRRQMRHSVSYPPGTADAFSDATPVTSPQGPIRSFTSGDVRSPTTRAAAQRRLSGAQSPDVPPEGRRVSLMGGVGVRAKAPGSPESPRAAWK